MASIRMEVAWVSEMLFVQPWKVAFTVLAGMIGRVRPARRDIRVKGLSVEWRRAYEAESSKHRDGG
jgi:hypothetical protein